MSGPLAERDAGTEPEVPVAAPATVEVAESRVAQVGTATVRRALPSRPRRTVGPWCFADHFGPVEPSGGGGLVIGPHPHIGLQTVTWLVAGELLHRDSLGSEQLIRPGQLNLMTAGHGVAHAEESTGSGTLHGAQLWIAQPERTRHGPPAFEHHAALPQAALSGGGTATVLVGALARGVASPARRDTDHVGAELDLPGGAVMVPLDPAFEHALMVLSGVVDVAGTTVPPGRLAYLGTGRHEVALSTVAGPVRALLLGGVPFGEALLMWWNFVARDRQEIDRAYRAWADDDRDRFPPVVSRLARLSTRPPPWRQGA